MKYLFRAKEKKTGVWRQGFPCRIGDREQGGACLNGIASLGGEVFEVDPETFCMATSYQNNSTRVFEGDILIYPYEKDRAALIRYWICLVRQGDVFLEMEGFFVDWGEPESELLRKDIGYWMGMKGVKIAGNCFDDPELLQNGQRI